MTSFKGKILQKKDGKGTAYNMNAQEPLFSTLE